MRTGQPFSVYEQRTVLFPGKFSDFLDNKIEHHEKPEGYVVSWRLQVNKSEVPMDFAKVSPNKNFPCIDLEYERIPQNIRDLFRPYFKQLLWKKEIVEDVDKVCKELGLFDHTSVHIREDLDWATVGRSKDLNRYFEEIDKHLQPKMFFIFHTQEMEDTFRKRYGDRVLTYPGKVYTNRNSSDLVGWVKDLLVLSRSKEIVADYQSSFDETAWWIGECKAVAFRIAKSWRDKK